MSKVVKILYHPSVRAKMEVVVSPNTVGFCENCEEEVRPLKDAEEIMVHTITERRLCMGSNSKMAELAKCPNKGDKMSSQDELTNYLSNEILGKIGEIIIKNLPTVTESLTDLAKWYEMRIEETFKSLQIVRRRFSDMNGEVSQKVWGDNYEAITILDNIIHKEIPIKIEPEVIDKITGLIDDAVELSNKQRDKVSIVLADCIIAIKKVVTREREEDCILMIDQIKILIEVTNKIEEVYKSIEKDNVDSINKRVEKLGSNLKSWYRGELLSRVLV